MAKRRYSHILGGVTSNSLVARFLAILQCDKFYEILRAKALRMTRVERGGKMPIYLFPAEHIRIASFTMVGSNIYPPLRMTSVERGGKVPNIYPRGDRREFDSFMKKAAFTLVEVLIVIGVIGIVAALTIPNLLQKYTERQNIIKLQRVYALLQQATRSMVAEHGELHTWADDSRDFYIAELSKQLKVVQNCSQANKCAPAMTYQYPAIVLIDGTVIGVQTRKANKSVGGSYHICSASVNAGPTNGYLNHYNNCSLLWVDLNGKGKPNRKGVDVFEFRGYRDGIAANGYPALVSSNSEGEEFNNCLKNKGNHGACTAWVIENKNMDYLRCPEKLGWNKAKSCSGK